MIDAVPTNKYHNLDKTMTKGTHSDEQKKRSEKRQRELEIEKAELGDPSVLVLDGKRVRKQAEHRDVAYVSASLRQINDAGKKGGLVAGSGHHYDRGYRNWGRRDDIGGFWRTEKQEEAECARHWY